MKILVAGATGAVGRRLVPLLVAAGHHVIATTRTPDKLNGLRAEGADPIVMDGLDSESRHESGRVLSPRRHRSSDDRSRVDAQPEEVRR